MGEPRKNADRVATGSVTRVTSGLGIGEVARPLRCNALTAGGAGPGPGTLGPLRNRSAASLMKGILWMTTRWLGTVEGSEGTAALLR